MHRTPALLACSLMILAAGCGKDSSLPTATGKGSIRAINAIPTSPEISFLIEERALSTINYQAATSPAPYDDLNYTFNFEVFYPGESAFRRIASRNIDVVANRDYTFLVSGTLTNASITVWEDEQRVFDEADTVFAARFAHASATLGDLDYYFADPAVVPALGNQVSTLSFGEVADAADFTDGDYVLTITTAGNPADVVYTSDVTTRAARDSYLFTVFDGDASDTAPVFVSAFGSLSGTFLLPDVNFPPTLQFVNASMELGAVDIYDDEMLTSRIVADHDFRDVSTELGVIAGDNTFYYTPAGETTAVLIETPLTAFGGRRYRSVAVGLASDVVSVPFAPDLRAVETGVKVVPFQTSNNFDFVDIYAVKPGTGIDDALPALGALTAGLATNSGVLPAGSYDIYITETGEKVPLAGPYRIDAAAGSVLDLIVVDTTDPAVLDVLFLSGGPAT